MEEYKIGIIEDDNSELNSIKRTIDYHLSSENSILFKDYKINESKLEYNDIIEKIKQDIINNDIMLLIVDNKLVVDGKIVNGTSIYEELKKSITDFPVVVMTNYREDAYKSDYVDPDKVYSKENFFANGEYTKEKINSINLMIEKYTRMKNNIIAEHEKIVKEYMYESKNEGQDKLNELLKLDLEKKKYTPVDTTYLEELISPDYIKEIIELLEEVKENLD